MAAPLPSWDLFISLFFIVGMAYGFMLQREKVVVSLLAAYAGLVVASTFFPTVQAFFQGEKTVFGQFFIASRASPFTIQVILFAATVALVTAKSGIVGKGSRGLISPLEVLVYSFFNSALILSVIFSFLPEADRLAIAEQSRLAAKVITLHHWWLALPLLSMVVSGLFLRRANYSE